MALTQTERLTGVVLNELIEFVMTKFHIKEKAHALEKINTMSNEQILDAILDNRDSDITVQEIKKILGV